MTEHDQHERIKSAIHEHAPQLFQLSDQLDEISRESREPPKEIMDWSRVTQQILYMYEAPIPGE